MVGGIFRRRHALSGFLLTTRTRTATQDEFSGRLREPYNRFQRHGSSAVLAGGAAAAAAASVPVWRADIEHLVAVNAIIMILL